MAVYERELRFIKLPPEMTAKRGSDGILQLAGAEGVVNASTIKTKRTMSFLHAFDLFPSTDSKRFLACTNPTTSKTSTAMGAMKDFCGVLTISGDVLFEFKPRKSELLAPFIFSQSGDYAVVYVGDAVEGDEGTRIANPREIWTWEAPAKALKHPGPWKDGPPSNPGKAINDLRRQFRRKP